MKFQKINPNKDHNYLETCNCQDCNTIREKKRMIKIIPIGNAMQVPSNVKDIERLPASLIKHPTQTEYEAENGIGNPGVTFDGINVYTQDSITTVPADVYNGIGNSNERVLNDVMTYGAAGNMEFCSITLANMVASNICCIVDRYISVLINIYEVYVANIKSSGIQAEFMNECYSVFDKDTIAESIINYSGLPENLKDTADLVSSTMASLNLYAARMYNTTKVFVDKYIVETNKSPEEITAIYETVNGYFARMMQNMIFEASVFIKTIQDGKHLLIGEDEYLKIMGGLNE